MGDGELHQVIVNKVKEKGLEGKVVFVGQVTNPEVYYSLADVLVIPSVFEGLSLATIESQIAGVPVVVSDAIPEEAIISNGGMRLALTAKNWADVAIEIAEKHVELNECSQEYNITYAVEKLENWYLEKFYRIKIGGII